jgi:hypothetical protein
MKRKWRIGRVVLAGVLLAGTVVLWQLWPMKPSWSVATPGEQLLCLDEQRSLIYVLSWPEESRELRSRDLRTGQLRSRVPVCPTQNIPEKPTESWNTMRWLLSPQRTWLVGVPEHFRDEIQVFDASTGRRVNHLRRWVGRRKIDSFGFSADDQLFAIRQGSRVWIWDLRSGDEVERVEIPIQLASESSLELPLLAEGIAISADHRYLATDGDTESVVYDIRTKRTIGRCEFRGLPHFRPDFRAITFTSVPDAPSGQVAQFSIGEGGRFKEVFKAVMPEAAQLEWSSLPSCELLSSVAVHEKRPGWPDWIAPRTGEMLESTLGLRQVQINVGWSEPNGRNTRHEASLFVAYGVPDYEPWSVRCSVTLGIVVFSFGGELSLWDIPPRRPLSCWLTCGGVALLAAWVGWPRRGRAVGSACPGQFHVACYRRSMT